MAIYGIIGGGSCPKNIIEDGLRDVGVEGNLFVIHGHKKPSSSEERVFDFLLENEADFHVIQTPQSPAPKVLLDAAVGVTDVEPTDKGLLTYIKDNSGSLLVLWDDEAEVRMNSIVLMADDFGIDNVRELSNGLVPIGVQDAQVEQAFTKEEVASMPSGVKKRNDIKQDDERQTMTAPEGDCMVTVVMPNGTVISTPATMAEVRVLLGLG